MQRYMYVLGEGITFVDLLYIYTCPNTRGPIVVVQYTTCYIDYIKPITTNQKS